MTRIVSGPTSWSMTRDSEGQREYKIKYQVLSATTDGPARALTAPGLPKYGAKWKIGGENDAWAWCRWDASVVPRVTGEPNTTWDIEFTFSTKPPSTKACKETQVEDPLLEPQKVSGNFTRYTEEATRDRFGFPILNSAYEMIRGPQVEFDANRPTIKIEQNVARLNLPLCASMVDTLNQFPLWGLGPRRIKLGNVAWERKFQGSCEVYYTRTFDFEIRYDGFDKDLNDEGTKALNGHWDQTTGHWVLDNINGVAPNPLNPMHYQRYKDKNGENTRVILDGKGLPYDPTSVEVAQWWRIFLPGEGTCVNLTCTAADAQNTAAGKEFIQGPYKDQFDCETDDTEWVADPCTGFSRPGRLHVEKYGMSNFLLLGIPVIF